MFISNTGLRMIYHLHNMDSREIQRLRFGIARRRRKSVGYCSDLSYRRFMLLCRARVSRGVDIMPVGNASNAQKRLWADSYTVDRGRYLLWYDLPNGSTGVIAEKENA